MADEEYNNIDDVVNQWINSGPKESSGPASIAHVQITVYMDDNTHYPFVDAEIMVVGDDIIVLHDNGSTIFNKRFVRFFEVEPLEPEES